MIIYLCKTCGANNSGPCPSCESIGISRNKQMVPSTYLFILPEITVDCYNPFTPDTSMYCTNESYKTPHITASSNIHKHHHAGGRKNGR